MAANDPTTEHTPTPWWLLGLCLIVSFAGILDRDVWTPDEPREAAIVLDMSRTGNVIIPRLAGLPFVEKPPLSPAVAAGFARLLGPVVGYTGAIRLSTAMWGLGCLAATFLLTRRLYDRNRALLACVILSTMVGFVENMHWIRVDAALAFFVIASVWCLVEVYLGGRRWYCLPAGLLGAGAFLSKGVIGPLLIGIGWLGLAIPWFAARRRPSADLFIVQHLLALLAFMVPAGAWMVMLRRQGGPELWHQWFYENHFGRLTGSATALGHIRTNPFYYLRTLVLYTLPWLPALAPALAGTVRDLRARRAIGPARVFLLTWSAGALALLTISKTKRDMYLTPMLPALAALCVDGWAGAPPRWLRSFANIWIGLCLLVLAASFLSPAWAGLLTARAPQKMVSALRDFGPRQVVAGAALVVALFVAFRRTGSLSTAFRLAGVTALLYIGIFAVPAKALDAEKSLKAGVQAFAARIPAERRARIAGWNFNETARAMFYYYADWSVPLVEDPKRMAQIIRGGDGEYDSVIVNERPALEEVLAGIPFRILAAADVGTTTHRRGLQWIARAATPGEEGTNRGGGFEK